MESHAHANFTPLVEFFRGDVAFNWETASIWLQVLTYGHDIARDGAKIFHQFDYFFEGFAEANHDSAFCQHPSTFAVTSGGSPLKQC
jgi:hypothetical protein